MRTPIGSLEYPGRLIVIGASAAGLPVIVYAITGRSASSQARKRAAAGTPKGNGDA